MGLFRRDKSSNYPSRKTRRAINEISKALESLRKDTVEADLAVSVRGLSLGSVIEDSSRLIAAPGYQDDHSIAHIERIAPILSFMAQILNERNHMQRSLGEPTPVNPDSSQSEPQTPAEQVGYHMNEALIKALNLMKNEIESYPPKTQ